MRYILFGSGDYYKRFSSWFVGKDVAAILDNDLQKQGTQIDGIRIVAPNCVKGMDYDAIVIMSFYFADMRKQLIELGVNEQQIFHFFDLHELFEREKCIEIQSNSDKHILLMSHDLLLGGPSMALFKAAKVLKRYKYDIYFASMINGPMAGAISEEGIPVIVDKRLQISTMNELSWTKEYDLIICNTISYHVFLSDRDSSIPVIWWLHDARRYYDGVNKDRLKKINTENMKILSVGPIPGKAINEFLPNINIDSLLYGVSENE